MTLCDEPLLTCQELAKDIKNYQQNIKNVKDNNIKLNSILHQVTEAHAKEDIMRKHASQLQNYLFTSENYLKEQLEKAGHNSLENKSDLL